MRNLFWLVLFGSLAGQAQKLENLKAIAQGEKIIITYDLSETFAGDRCDIQLYSSHNNFSMPLQHVSGDIGRGLPAGKGKRIEWEAKIELGNYQGELSFEVRAEVIGLLTFKNGITNAKRGKTVSIVWRGGSKNENVKVELLKDGVLQSGVATTTNIGNYQWNVPLKQKTGGGYQIRLVNGKEMITTDFFSVRHKIPTLLKILPAVAAGVVVGLLSGSKGSSGTPTKSSDLASPPDLGLN
ncbi:MAG: hypothetical protein HYR67_14610 [Bacteroidetes bacterium]|nr:hypothetical protein [Bacteroidota bacterium]